MFICPERCAHSADIPTYSPRQMKGYHVNIRMWAIGKVFARTKLGIMGGRVDRRAVVHSLTIFYQSNGHPQDLAPQTPKHSPYPEDYQWPCTGGPQSRAWPARKCRVNRLQTQGEIRPLRNRCKGEGNPATLRPATAVPGSKLEFVEAR